MSQLNDWSITIKTRLSQKDYINAKLAIYKAKKITRKILIFLFLFVAVQVTLFIASSTKSSENPPPEHLYSSFLRIIIFIIFIGIFIIFASIWITKLGAKKYYDSNKLIQKEQTYIFSYEGIEHCSDSSSAILKWTDIYKITETKDAILLYVSNMTAYMIPKRDFPSSELELFKTKVYPKFPKKKLIKMK